MEGAYACVTPEELLAIDGVRAMQAMVHKTATDAGWYVDPATGQPIKRNFGEVIALAHSELSEALEADRKGKTRDDKLPWHDARAVELGDCIIRILDTAAALGFDMATVILDKNRYNRERQDHKIANRAQPGGKRY